MKATFLLSISYALCVLSFSCSQDPSGQAPESMIPTGKMSRPEEAFPNQPGVSKTGLLNGQKVNYRLIGNQAIFESDILLSTEDLLAVTSAEAQSVDGTGRTKSSTRWPNKIVYYSIDPSLPNQTRVTDAISHWETYTPIRFVQRTNQRGYVLFRTGSGCSSNVGYSGGLQYVNLGSGCTTGNAIHEIGHTIGLWHEHTRADRDTYVNVNTTNILSGYESDFQTYVDRGLDGFDYDGGLDFGSIMLYGSYDFSKNGLPTITKKDGSTFVGQRTGLSPVDVNTVLTMYPASTELSSVRGTTPSTNP